MMNIEKIGRSISLEDLTLLIEGSTWNGSGFFFLISVHIVTNKLIEFLLQLLWAAKNHTLKRTLLQEQMSFYKTAYGQSQVSPKEIKVYTDNIYIYRCNLLFLI